MARKGMGYGTGKGYKNIAGSDPKVHSQSSKGIKQPQQIPTLNHSKFKQITCSGCGFTYQSHPNIFDEKKLNGLCIKCFHEKELKINSTNNLKFMDDQYSFDTMEDRVVRTTIDPEKFLRDTMEESNQTYLNQGKEPRYNKDFNKFIKEVLHEGNVIGIKAVLEGKKKSKYLIPRPFIEYNKGVPYAHEGRHTMEAMRRMGIKNAPVTIIYHHEGENYQPEK